MTDEHEDRERAPSPVDRGVAMRETAAALLLLLFAVGATYMAFDFGEEARRLPLVVGFPLTIMASINLFLVIREQWLRPASVGVSTPALAGGGTASSELDGQEDQAEALRRAQQQAGNFDGSGEGLSLAASLAALAAVTGLFMLLGLIPAAVLFTTGFVRFVGRESWRKSLGMSALLVILFWLFRTLLNVRFYQGWLAAEDYIPYVLPF